MLQIQIDMGIIKMPMPALYSVSCIIYQEFLYIPTYMSQVNYYGLTTM